MEKTTDVTVKEVMKDAYVMRENASIIDALKVIFKEKSDFLAIVDDEGRLVGVLGEHDMIKLVRERLPSGIAGEVWFDYIDESQKTGPVKEICERNPVIIGAEDTLDAALKLMNANKKRTLAVVENEKLVGIIRLRDIFDRLTR